MQSDDKNKTSKVFTDAEKAAMAERAVELKAEAVRGAKKAVNCGRSNPAATKLVIFPNRGARL